MAFPLSDRVLILRGLGPNPWRFSWLPKRKKALVQGLAQSLSEQGLHQMISAILVG
jgi:hypothetical protein